jgi:hypothetical protein
MNPRSFLNFFHTRSGKLLLFGCLFGFGLFLYSQTRHKTTDPQDNATAKPLDPNSKTNKPQVVETVQRAMEVFRPPPPKPDPKSVAVVTNKPAEAPVARPPEPAPPPPLPISLFADTVNQQSEPKALSSDYAPFGRLISCETVITVDSSSIHTPIIGLITEDIYHAGRLIIPAGTEVHGTAAPDRVRERLASGNSWTLVWQTGEELRLNAIALDREFENDTNQVGWAITDGSAGLRGRVIKTDDLAEIKLFAATFLSGAADALTEKQQTVFGPINSPTLNNAPFEGAQKVLSVYAKQIYDAIQRDGFYVRVPSGKQFYLYVLQTIDRADARIGGSGTAFSQTNDFTQASVMPVAQSINAPNPSALPNNSRIQP